MPKRPASSSEDSPRKLTRQSSKSPASQKDTPPPVSTEEVPTTISSSPVHPSPTPPPHLPAPSSADADLMNISDEELDVVPTSTTLPEENCGPVLILASLDDLRALRERFFEKFMNDVVNSGDGTINANVYRSIVAEIAEEDPSEQRSIVDQHMRDFVIEKMANKRESWDRFLELSIQLSREFVCSASSPIALISDFMELSSLEQCEEIFEFVEQRLNVWKDPFFLNSGKNAVLRMCNDLLRRLSRAQNTIFCGRILLFLSNYFPFSERSGLNIMSEFNSENTTSYKSGDGSDDPEDKMEQNAEEHADEKLFEGMDIGIPGLDKIVSITQEEKKKKVKVDYNLYVKFWSLQDFFRNPTQCYNKVSWKSFTLYIQDVLGAFTSFKVDGCQTQHQQKLLKEQGGQEMMEQDVHNRSHSSAINVVPKLGDADLYFPKYLTNRRLLELQMGDPNFRRHFMVQLLIILQYLTTSVKFKSENQTLGEDQLEFVKKTTERIFTLLKDIKPAGKEFVKAVQHILKREDLWSKWKNDGCQPFKKPTANVPIESSDSDKKEGGDNSLPDPEEKSAEEPSLVVPTKKRQQLGDILEEAEKNGRFLLGNPELTRLWNICGDNLEACRSESRDFLPTIDNFFVDAFKELDPEPTPANITADPSKRQVKPKKTLGNPNFGWRALRLLARNSPFFFQLAPSPPVQPLQNYLEYILKKIAMELEIPKEEMLQDDDKLEDSKAGIVSAQEAVENDGADGDQVMEGDADENDELLKAENLPEQRIEEEEEGEVDEKVRNLTEQEQKAIGRLIGDAWKKLALKFQFTKDEIEFFESEKGKEAGSWMLKMWTEQEKEDATAADLLYQLEGLKLRELVREVFP